MLAPVRANDPIVTWPKAGAAPTSTVLPLSPYRPLDFAATIPCSTLRAVNTTAPGGGTALSTQPHGGPGLGVSAANGTASFWVSGTEVLAEPLPGTQCTYQVIADDGGVRVLRDGTTLVARPDLLPPQVAELATQAPQAQANGLRVELHTDARYESTPTTLKLVLITAHLIALTALLVLAWQRWRGTQSLRGLSRPKWSPADAVMLLISAAWVFLGPANMDDSWYLMMARNAGESGYVGNFVYMFNVTENPFVLSQYLQQFWGSLGGWSLWWMRLVPTICGVLTYALLRVLLATMLGRAADLRVVPWALLVAHLVWYLPYGTTLRPEPVIVLFAAATLVFAEAALLRRSIGALAVATALAALALTASPSGVVAAAPLVLSMPWLVRWLRMQPWSARVAAVLLGPAAGTVLVPVGFADATLGDVIEASQVHRWYYLSFPWYEEFAHFETLLDTAGWARRLPVLLAIAIVAVVALASGRGGMGRDPIRRLVLISTATTAVAFALITLSPTKWVNHFHSVAAAPTVLLAAALLRTPLPRRAGPVVTSVAVLTLVGAVSLSFAGDNWWIPFTDSGQRFGNHMDPNPLTTDLAPHLGSFYLRSPLPWIGIALAAFLWAKYRRRMGKLVRIGPDRAVLGAACLGAVLLMLALFVYAPISHHPGWTVARSGVQTLFGNGCGLASDVRVQLPTQRGLSEPQEPAQLGGDFVNDRAVPVHTDPWAQPTRIWHDEQPDGATTGTGELVTGWYSLPPGGTGTHVTVPVSGGLRDQDVSMQFGRQTAEGWQVTWTEPLGSDLRRPLTEWQQLDVVLPDPRPEAIRIVVNDRITGAGTWVAVAEPKLTEARPVSELTRDRPVLANHISSAMWPCVNQVGIRHGITDTPQVRMIIDETLPQPWTDNISNLPWGGAWVQTARTWVQTEIPAELEPAGPPRIPWGHVFAVRYLHPVGQYDLRVHTVTRPGWTRLPTLADNTYPDIEFNYGLQPSTTDTPGAITDTDAQDG